MLFIYTMIVLPPSHPAPLSKEPDGTSSSSRIQFISVSPARGETTPAEFLGVGKEADGTLEESSEEVGSCTPSANSLPSCTLQRTLCNDALGFGGSR
jgi:hypothetical protein